MLPTETSGNETLEVGRYYRYKDTGGHERFKVLKIEGSRTYGLAVFRSKEGEIAVLTVGMLAPENYVEVTKEDFENKVKEVIADLMAVLNG